MIWTVQREVVGIIARSPSGAGGFGYDPVFLLPELNRTMAELARNKRTGSARADGPSPSFVNSLLAVRPFMLPFVVVLGIVMFCRGGSMIAIHDSGRVLLSSRARRDWTSMKAKFNRPLVVPAGTAIPISLTSRISTKNAKDGDGVYGKTAFPDHGRQQDCDSGRIVCARQNHRGQEARPGEQAKPSSRLHFQTLVLPSGITIPIYTSLGGTGGAGRAKR